MTTIKVRFDGRVFVPEQPIDLPQGRVLEIQIPELPATGAPDGNGTPKANGATAHQLPQEQTQQFDEFPLMAILEIANSYPDDSDLPTDGAAQHDHYLYGTPNGNGAQSETPPLAGLLEMLSQLPDDPNTPTDLAAQHDHYLHGIPKRP